MKTSTAPLNDGDQPAPVRLIVFAKAPRPGLAKTRLIPALGADGAARLAQRMLDHTLAQALAAQLGPVELCMSPAPDSPEWQSIELPANVGRSDQGAGDLGERMARAMDRALTAGQPVLLMGTDGPGLTAAFLQEAARKLAQHDAVLLPVRDGGYLLIGLRAPCPAIFQQMAWSTAGVASETLRRLAALNLSVWLGPTLHDIDDPQDLTLLPPDWGFSYDSGINPSSNGHLLLSI